MDVDLFIKKMPHIVKELISREAFDNRRSLNQEAIALLEEALVHRVGAPASKRKQMETLLEGYAGERACKTADDTIARDLDANCDQLQQAIAATAGDDLDAIRVLVDLNSRFHDRILHASGSKTVLRTLEALRMPVAYRLYIWRVPERRQFSLDCHRRIAEAFRAGQPKQVRRLMEAHLLEARDFLLAAKR